jgi:Transposase
MKYVGVDLHKQTISVCVMVKAEEKRVVEQRRSLRCGDTESIRRFFERLGSFRMVVEATSSYEWLFLLIEDLADRCVLAHPKKLRVIAESTQKSDKIDAKVLAEFLLLDMIPEAHRPSPRLRQYRVLVRHRHAVQRGITRIKCKLRHKLAFYNADIASLFTARGQEHLAKLAMSHADRFECDALWEQLSLLHKQLAAADKELKAFAQTAPAAERHARSGTGHDRRRAQRNGRRAAVPQRQAGGRLRGDGSLLPGECGKRQTAAHQQGRLAALAVGPDRDRLAAGGEIGPLAATVRSAASDHRTQKESHRGGGPPGAVRDVRHAPRRRRVSGGRRLNEDRSLKEKRPILDLSCERTL